MPVLFASWAAFAHSPTLQAQSGTTLSGKAALVAPSSEQRPVANLPFAQGRSFASLDEYLEFRRQRGAYDVPWYREVRPGVYELVSRRGPRAQPQIYTRAELARMFGFEE